MRAWAACRAAGRRFLMIACMMKFSREKSGRIVGLMCIARRTAWGCDDLDGTVVWYDITKKQGDGVHQELHVSDIHRIIRETGREPVERDTLYRPVGRVEVGSCASAATVATSTAEGSCPAK